MGCCGWGCCCCGTGWGPIAGLPGGAIIMPGGPGGTAGLMPCMPTGTPCIPYAHKHHMQNHSPVIITSGFFLELNLVCFLEKLLQQM